jgi:hypothetical protein
MYRKFDVTENLLFAQYFFEEVNTAIDKILTTTRVIVLTKYLILTST